MIPDEIPDLEEEMKNTRNSKYVGKIRLPLISLKELF